MTSLAAFEQTLHQNWADSFHCPRETIHQAGTTVLPMEKYAGEKVVIFWHIGEHAFVQLDPQYTSQVTDVLNDLPTGTSLSGNDLQRAWGDAVKSRDVGQIHYLFPPDLPPFAPTPPFTLRQLTEADAAHMTSLHDANTPADVEKGYVEVTHEIAFGCFADGQLAAAASGYTRTGFMDIGVLVHPSFRHKGFGKAVVGAVCEWSVRKGIIAQYRHNVLNPGSQGVANSLNFRQNFKSESVWMR